MAKGAEPSYLKGDVLFFSVMRLLDVGTLNWILNNGNWPKSHKINMSVFKVKS